MNLILYVFALAILTALFGVLFHTCRFCRLPLLVCELRYLLTRARRMRG